MNATTTETVVVVVVVPHNGFRGDDFSPPPMSTWNRGKQERGRGTKSMNGSRGLVAVGILYTLLPFSIEAWVYFGKRSSPLPYHFAQRPHPTFYVPPLPCERAHDMGALLLLVVVVHPRPRGRPRLRPHQQVLLDSLRGSGGEQILLPPLSLAVRIFPSSLCARKTVNKSREANVSRIRSTRCVGRSI